MDISSPLPLFDGATPTKVTTLDNGLKVASADLPTPAATVGLYVGTGSKYEAVGGSAHVLQHMAFKSTHGRSELKMVRDCERLGASVACTASRESIVYQVDTLSESVPEADASPTVVSSQDHAADQLNNFNFKFSFYYLTEHTVTGSRLVYSVYNETQ